jgi:hypothetical protein
MPRAEERLSPKANVTISVVYKPTIIASNNRGAHREIVRLTAGMTHSPFTMSVVLAAVTRTKTTQASVRNGGEGTWSPTIARAVLKRISG